MADTHAPGFVILQLLTHEYPEVLRERVKNERFWRELKRTLLAGGLSKRKADIFLNILRRLTHPD